MTTPMEIDADILTTDIPEVRPTSPSPPPDTTTTEPAADGPSSSRKKAKRTPADPSTKKKEEQRVPGTTSLPVARVKRILGADEELQNIGREALFLLSVATEQFLKRMADSGYLKARMEGRKVVTLKDLSSAVRQHPEMEFLSDIIPAAVPLSVALAQKKQNAQDPAAFSSLTNQPLSALLPTVPMLPSKNPDFPDALVRRSKDPNKARGRKSAAGAGGADAGAEGDGAGEGGEAEAEEGVSVKKPKAKPRARKSVVVEAEPMSGKTGEASGLEKTLADQAAKAVSLSRPKPTKKIAAKPKPVEPVPVGIRGSSEAAEDAMDDGW